MTKKNELLNAQDESLMLIGKLPNLHEADVSPRELASEYWTPETDGEYKVGVIMDIRKEDYPVEGTDERVDLDCIIMISQEPDGSFNTIRNGSKRLVATILTAMESGEIELEKTPIKITYIGKAKNKTNAFKSDRWSVKPLLIA